MKTKTDNRVNQLETQIKKLEEQCNQQQDQIKQQADKIEQQEQQINQLEKEKSGLQMRLDELDANVAELDDRMLEKDVKKGIIGDIHCLKQQIKDDIPTPETEEVGYNGSEIAETQLEQVVSMPDKMAEEQLSPNQQRARHVACNLSDYSQPCAKGKVITPSDLKKVLSARFDTTHSETVNRVREFLADLGGECVEINQRRSTKSQYQTSGKRLVFDKSIARRLSRISD